MCSFLSTADPLGDHYFQDIVPTAEKQDPKAPRQCPEEHSAWIQPVAVLFTACMTQQVLSTLFSSYVNEG